MKVGAEPRKVAILAVLLVVAAYLIYSNVLSPDAGIPEEARSSAAASTPAPAPPVAVAPRPAAPAPSTARRTTIPSRRRGRSTVSQEWIPSVGPRRPEDRPDPLTVDPSLDLDLLARLKNITITGGERSLFDFSQPPAPKVPEPKILPKPVAQEKPSDNGKAPEQDKPKSAKPPPPPIPLKFYGFVTGMGPRRAFFLNGDEIFVASEGELVQKRYKIVRIGVNSAVVADAQHEDHQQSIALEALPVS